MAPRLLPQTAVLVTVVAVVGAFRAPRPGLAPRSRQAPGPRRRRDARAFSASEITPDAFTEKAWEALPPVAVKGVPEKLAWSPREKLLGVGCAGYWRDGWNRLDGTIVILSLIHI